VHYTWGIAVVMITWSLAVGYFPMSYPGWDRQTYWLMGAISALLLFASVLFHELCHSFVAQARGLSVHSITLFILSGVSSKPALFSSPWKKRTQLRNGIFPMRSEGVID
jgi:Zn-dependent protease